MEKLILGPMATLCHEGFRRLVEDFGGCDEYFTEMINAPALKCGGQWEKFYLMNDCAPDKMVWQLTGNNIDAFEWACGEVLKNGGIGIDLNMGCSAPQIIRAGSGIVWMMEENWKDTATLVSKCRKAIDNFDFCNDNEQNEASVSFSKKHRLSAKIRLGDENYTIDNLVKFCKILENEGVEMITLHPRTKKEKYRQKARWDVAGIVSEKINIPLILNGDICDKRSFEEAKKACPKASGFMIARSAAQKPWIFKELSLKEGEYFEVNLEQTALNFIDYLEKYQPKEFWKTRLQRFFAYYSLNLSFAHYAQSKFLNAFTPEQARFEVKDYFLRQESDRIKIIK